MIQRGVGRLITAVAAALLAVACLDEPRQQVVTPPEPRIVEPERVGDSVFYFPVTGANYRASLSAFLAAHPELRCRYFGADDKLSNNYPFDSSVHAQIVGHTLVCTDIAQNAQDETIP